MPVGLLAGDEGVHPEGQRRRRHRWPDGPRRAAPAGAAPPALPEHRRGDRAGSRLRSARLRPRRSRIAVGADHGVHRGRQVGVGEAVGHHAVDDPPGASTRTIDADPHRRVPRGPEVELVRRLGLQLGGDDAADRRNRHRMNYRTDAGAGGRPAPRERRRAAGPSGLRRADRGPLGQQPPGDPVGPVERSSAWAPPRPGPGRGRGLSPPRATGVAPRSAPG